MAAWRNERKWRGENEEISKEIIMKMKYRKASMKSAK
jgi:hypothetical protein